MPPSDRPGRPIDWRGWIVLVWVLWFGLLYAKMVVEQRGQRLQGWITKSTPR